MTTTDKLTDDEKLANILQFAITKGHPKLLAALACYDQCDHNYEKTLENVCINLSTTLTTQQSEINRLREGMTGDYDLDAWLDWAKEKEQIIELVSRHDEVTAQWSKELQEKDEQISALESRHIQYLTGKCTCPKKDNPHPKAVHWPGCPMILLEEIDRLRELIQQINKGYSFHEELQARIEAALAKGESHEKE